VRYPLRIVVGSCQQLRDDFTVHVGEPKIAALEAIREAQVVEPEEVEQGRVEVVNMHPIRNGVVTQFVRLPDERPRLEPSPVTPSANGSQRRLRS